MDIGSTSETPTVRRHSHLAVQVISESVFGRNEHGVHSAFADHVESLRAQFDTAVTVNGLPRNNVDVTHVHTIGPYALIALALQRKRRERPLKVVSAHITCESLSGSLAGARYAHWATSRYLAWAYNRADVVIAVSSCSARELASLGVRKPIAVAPNSVPLQAISRAAANRSRFREILGIDRERLAVISVGQIQPRKGVEEFLSVARRAPEIFFVWVGDSLFGPASADRAHLRRLQQAAPANVKFTGGMSRPDVFNCLNACDVYLSLSRQETFGLAPLEAAAAGLPLLLTPLAAFKEIYGESVQYVDQYSVMNSLHRLSSASSRSRWGLAAFKVARRYTQESSLQALIRIYEGSHARPKIKNAS